MAISYSWKESFFIFCYMYMKKHLHIDIFWLCSSCWEAVSALLSCSYSSFASHSLGLPWGQLELCPGEPLLLLQAIRKHYQKLQEGTVYYIFF